MISNRFTKNTIWLLSGQIFKMLISFVVGMLTARYLGPSNYGLITYVNSYLSFFTAIVGLGLDGVIVYEFGKHRDEEGKILGTAIFMRFAVGVLSFFAMVAVVMALDGKDRTLIWVCALQAVQLPFLAFNTFNNWYQSKLASKYAVIAQTMAYVCTSAYKIFILATGKSVEWFAFAASLDVILLAVFYALMFMRKNHIELGFSFTVWKRILKKSRAFILADIMVFLYGQMDRIMLKQLLGSTEKVGLYSAATVIAGLIALIPTGLLDSGRPIIVEAKISDEGLYQKRIRQLFAGIIWVCFAYSLGITFLSKWILQVLYGEAYLGADLCLKIVVWYTAFSFIGSGKSLWLICEKKEKYVFVLSAMGAVTNLLLNWLMIPQWGINGAAIATLVTQVFANILYPIVFKDTRGYAVCVWDAIRLKNIHINEVIDSIIKKKVK